MSDTPSENRLLHTMIRVMDLDKSVDFYTQCLGMKLIRRHDFEEARFTLAFVGYGDEKTGAVLELTHNWDQKEPYTMGDAFGHLAIAVPDAYKLCQELEQKGMPVPRPAGPMKGSSRVIAFVEDPDGYKIELIQND
jgi:lactoylglutathione lyase